MKKICAVFLSLLFSTFAQAMIVTVDFTAMNFTPFGANATPPDSLVTGKFVYDAATKSAPISHLLSVNMTIDGHAYLLDEIGFENGPVVSLIGGRYFSIGAVTGGNSDFGLLFDRENDTFNAFSYAVPQTTASLWIAGDGTVDINASQVPEPSGFALLSLALLGLVATTKGKKS